VAIWANSCGSGSLGDGAGSPGTTLGATSAKKRSAPAGEKLVKYSAWSEVTRNACETPFGAKVPGRRLDPPVADEEGDLARDHVERLVLAAVE
jgi:hypothetical protein